MRSENPLTKLDQKAWAVLEREREEALRQLAIAETRLAQLRRESRTDPLTGLLNRRGGEEALAVAQKRSLRNNLPLSVIMVDLDHFKLVNDTWGHPEGDLVLQRAAQAIKAVVRDTDSAVRWGGEEFLVVSDNGNLGARVLAERILDAIRRTVFAGPEEKPMTASAGCSQVFHSNPSDAISRADQALYAAKGRGRNRVGIL